MYFLSFSDLLSVCLYLYLSISFYAPLSIFSLTFCLLTSKITVKFGLPSLWYICMNSKIHLFQIPWPFRSSISFLKYKNIIKQIILHSGSNMRIIRWKSSFNVNFVIGYLILLLIFFSVFGLILHCRIL